MDLYYIDYISVSGKSWLNRVPAAVKMFLLAALIALVLWIQSAVGLAIIFAGLLIIVISARLPLKIYGALSLYPIIFLLILFLSIHGLTWRIALVIGLRVLDATGFVVAFLLSTSFPVIFGLLSRVLPDFVVTALFFSYRCIFVISNSLSNVQTAMHLRGGIDLKRPLATIRNFGMALGYFLVHSIESSERMADGLHVRGFSNKIYYLGGKR